MEVALQRKPVSLANRNSRETAPSSSDLTHKTLPALPHTWPISIEKTKFGVAHGIELSVQTSHLRIAQPKFLTVLVHGFCGNKSENGLFDVISRVLANSGGVVVQYDWRGIGDSSGNFIRSNLGQHVNDFKKLVSWLSSPDQCWRDLPVTAVGFSLGATIVGLALQKGVRLDRVAYLSPATRPRISMWPRYDTDTIRQSIEQRGFAEKEDSCARFGKAILDSIRDTDLGEQSFALTVPLLVCYGTHDTRIKPSHTKKIIETSRQKAKGLESLCLHGASHSFRPHGDHWQGLATKLSSFFTGDGNNNRYDKYKSSGGRSYRSPRGVPKS